MSLIQLVYASQLRGDESVLSAIHSHAVRNNTAHTITGMLLYANRRFLQVLEGERDVVHATFSHIKADPRHEQVTLILDQPRRFGEIPPVTIKPTPPRARSLKYAANLP